MKNIESNSSCGRGVDGRLVSGFVALLASSAVFGIRLYEAISDIARDEVAQTVESYSGRLGDSEAARRWEEKAFPVIIDMLVDRDAERLAQVVVDYRFENFNARLIRTAGQHCDQFMGCPKGDEGSRFSTSLECIPDSVVGLKAVRANVSYLDADTDGDVDATGAEQIFDYSYDAGGGTDRMFVCSEDGVNCQFEYSLLVEPWDGAPQLEGFQTPDEFMEWFLDSDVKWVRETCGGLFDEHLSKVPLASGEGLSWLKLG